VQKINNVNFLILNSQERDDTTCTYPHRCNMASVSASDVNKATRLRPRAARPRPWPRVARPRSRPNASLKWDGPGHPLWPVVSEEWQQYSETQRLWNRNSRQQRWDRKAKHTDRLVPPIARIQQVFDVRWTFSSLIAVTALLTDFPALYSHFIVCLLFTTNTNYWYTFSTWRGVVIALKRHQSCVTCQHLRMKIQRQNNR